ncbi:MAG: response regulator [Phycisphaerales bacterium]|nr:response regulator [Phycisphaerales bacterium]
MNQPHLRVMVVDDEPRLCAAWERLLSVQTDMELVRTLDRADHLAAEVAEHAPDVVLLDLPMPDEDPLTASARCLCFDPRLASSCTAASTILERLNSPRMPAPLDWWTSSTRPVRSSRRSVRSPKDTCTIATPLRRAPTMRLR